MSERTTLRPSCDPAARATDLISASPAESEREDRRRELLFNQTSDKVRAAREAAARASAER